MDEFIGRVRLPTTPEHERAYRLPKEVSRKRVWRYVPHSVHGMHADTLRYASTNHAWYEALNRTTTRLAKLDIKWIEVHGRSRFLHIKLAWLLQPVTDYGNRWEQIEKVLAKELGLPIRNYEPRRLKWWPKPKGEK